MVVPKAVAAEVGRHVADKLAAGFRAGWLKHATPANLMLVDEIARDIGGRGEAEVIAPALETGDAVVLIDERAARAYAVARGLQVRGTLGIVLHAKQEGPIELATPLLDELGTVASGSTMQRIEGHASWHLHLRTATADSER